MRREQREREFTEFYAGSAAALRRTAYVVVRDWHLAEDLTQQAMAETLGISDSFAFRSSAGLLRCAAL